MVAREPATETLSDGEAIRSVWHSAEAYGAWLMPKPRKPVLRYEVFWRISDNIYDFLMLILIGNAKCSRRG
jgi:hypothetical protein